LVISSNQSVRNCVVLSSTQSTLKSHNMAPCKPVMLYSVFQETLLLSLSFWFLNNSMKN